ncbi:hypothetical protein PHMEG_00019642 [Phytophthora megakarya]|uniref:ATP-dependent DNA helicase n=1 Tax=Phytophthora megakarya TaxID=4795 RepID=A0A225VRW8_9STRA|nr:hypothetical protein PHMEG_00019642 [Phytophthora megakarya]
MFVSAGRRLMEALSRDDTDVPREPIMSFLGGKPGAGKSQVIRALQALASSWKCSEAAGTVSYQGVAAQSANGETIHKFFGWRLGGFSKTQQVTAGQREKMCKLKLLIMDEVSTTDAKIIGMVDSSLRHIRNEPDLVFGGVDVLFVGDWLQQQPVAGVVVYVSVPPYCGHQHGDYFFQSRGIQAYSLVRNVVMLTENMRYRNDPEWRDILDRWRVGNYTQSDVDKVNSLCYTNSWRSRNLENESFCPIHVTSNALRSQLNALSLRAYGNTHHIDLHRFPAVVSRRKVDLDGTTTKSLKTIRDDKTAGMAIMLEIGLGAPVQCTKNTSRSLKLANGSIGFVTGFVPASTDKPVSTTHSVYTEVTHSKSPEVVFIKLRDYEDVQFFPFLPNGVVPVRLRYEKSVKVQLPNRSFSINIIQVPVIPAYSITTEKCQGMTLEKIVLAPLRHATRRSPQRSSFYVAATRVKSLRQLYLMEKLSLEELTSYFTPNPAAMAETRRLEALEQ